MSINETKTQELSCILASVHEKGENHASLL